MNNQNDSTDFFYIDIASLTAPLPRRTSVTKLTDDELLLMDALFEMSGISTGQLSQDSYPIHMNTGYTHKFSKDQLRSTLESWKSQGWVSNDFEIDIDDEPRWELTASGGDLWERERQPIWDRYVAAWTYYDPIDEEWCANIEDEFRLASEDRPTTIIVSPDLSMVNSFADTVIACHLYRPASPERQYFTSNTFEVSYKKFTEVHCLCLHVEPEGNIPDDAPPLFTDWDFYKRHCVWWRDVDELNQLRTKLGL